MLKMEKEKYPCPCGGRIEWKRKKAVIEGIDCGVLSMEYCNRCGSEYFPEESMRVIEQKLKEAGLWGVQRKEASFWKSGNSVVLRIPVKIANALRLRANMRANLYQEGKNKLVVEI